MEDEKELKVVDRRRFIQEGDTIRENPDAQKAEPTPAPEQELVRSAPQGPPPPGSPAGPAQSAGAGTQPANASPAKGPQPAPGAPQSGPQAPPPGAQAAGAPQGAQPPAEQTRREAAQRRADQAAAGLPPADMTTLVEFLVQQISMYLGEPDPMSGRAMQPNLPLAGLFIDLLGTLQEKTKGNLSLEEGQILDQVLYTLRLRYVQQRR